MTPTTTTTAITLSSSSSSPRPSSMMGTRTTDCRKFTPNIFNKSKCSHCFRQREEHSAAALESNRASRKVSKCGYLFVAPDWDFNNPLYRTKRWQRRWFVLYDDGELTYSVDEHPETVPQASIDMTKVLEVTTAEDVTGHTNSIAITAPDRVTFVKGTCPEEAKWWLNILIAFPKTKGRHKRNATFPGGQATTIIQTTTAPNNRNRHNSYHKDTLTSGNSLDVIGNTWDTGTQNSVITPTAQDENNKNAGNEITNRVYTDQPVSSKSPPTRDKIHPESKAQARIRNRNRTAAPSIQDDSESVSSCLLIEDVRRDEKLKDIANTITNLSHNITNNRWSTTTTATTGLTTNSSAIAATQPNSLINSALNHNQSSLIRGGNDHNNNNNSNDNDDDDQPTRDETDFHSSSSNKQDFHKVINLRPKSLPLASSTAPAIVSAIVKKIPPVCTSASSSSSSSSTATTTTTNGTTTDCKSSSPRLQHHNSLKHQQQHQHHYHHLHHLLHHHYHLTQNQAQERGDPDGGCNLDDSSTNYLSKTSELRVNLPAEEILNSKKGWLMKQDSRTGEWTKHWFTLRGAALFYYRDPVSEERGVLDGVLDVNSLTNINEITSTRNYAFQLTTWDNRRIILASVSANSRSNWINVLRNAAGIQSSPPPPPPPSLSQQSESKAIDDLETELLIKDTDNDDLKTEIEKDFIKAQRNQEIIINQLGIHESANENSGIPSSIKSPGTTLTATVSTSKPVNISSDEEYRTASEGGRRDSIDWGSPLSPSPPVPLAIFRAKERMRSRSSTSPRLHKRSRSSPPSSRRSTVDSVGSDELPLIHPVQEEFNIDKELQIRLSVAEKERDILREDAREREARMAELLSTLERTELELTSRIREVEDARDNLSRQLADSNCKADQIIKRLTTDLEESQMKIKDLEDRLSRGIEENEGLYKKLRELEGCNPSSFSNLNRSKMRRVDSLSDLTNLTEIDPYGLERDILADEYNELRSRFEKAVNEIKAMKKELRESQNQYDSLEISYAALKQDLERKESEDRCQLQMMAERIQDLTLKYTSSERQVRTLKQKLAKAERRRSSSLKGKEQVIVPKEVEEKVTELENKISEIEKITPSEQLQVVEKTEKRTNSNSRRRSLESSTASTDSLQFMVRLNALEKRIDSASQLTGSIPEGNTLRSVCSPPRMSEHLVERLKCLEGVLVSSKDRIEQSLQQLHSLRSSRTRRSVSPITDRKDSFRFVERCLTEVVKLIRESCETCIVGEVANSSGVLLLPESNPIKLALMQLEAQLRSKLGDLLKQRRVLRERNELTSRKEMELLAERIAFESVCFGKLRDSISRAEDSSLFGQKQAKVEVAETSQLMSLLKAKLGGKCAFKPTGSLDILASVLARRLVLSSHKKSNNKKTTKAMPEIAPVDSKVLDELLRQQTEINIISKRYKNNAMEMLASGLAAETLSYMSSTDAVQGAVQEAWRQAQEAVNAELVQSEIAHIMMKNAERFENSIALSFGYTLTMEERITFENFADAVHDTLRREMDNAIEQLTRCYEDSLQKMKRGQWRLHLEQERKASESRQLLSEFADIIAHKALVDARIAVLRGDYRNQSTSSGEQSKDFNVGMLQKYENLFEELANDLQICNANDILAEADFDFIYKKCTIDFVTDRPHLKEVSEALANLEESIVLLHSTLSPNTSITTSSFDIENLQGICIKCRELRKRIDGMINCAQNLAESCKHCEKMQDSLCNLTAKHETEIKSLQQIHDKDLTVLRKQLEDHVNSIKALETERNSLLEELTLQSNLVEDHERELAAITLKLKCKEEECHHREQDNVDLTDKLEDQENSIRNLKDENYSLNKKCIRQDEEYIALLQERDYIQAELSKERERSRKLEKRLEMLEIEHTRQLECLQEAYKDQILSHCSDFSGVADEESFRQRYQTEIEQLRTLCEKGLAAMESSHRRIINDLEEKHRKEIERLLIEKEQALAEETQATLAALDAMRKAHQSEVQREVARFKQEFLRQFQKGEQSSVPIREKEEELEELRQEILSFSEKYSIKCVENAALEERLRVANQKLKQFQQMQQLELRNKQFRAHLASEDPSDLNFVQGLTKDDMPSPDSEHERNEFVVNTMIPTTTTCIDSPSSPIIITTTTTTSSITPESCSKNYHQNHNQNQNHTTNQNHNHHKNHQNHHQNHQQHPLPVSQNNCKKEIHPRSGFNEGIKSTTIYNDVTKPIRSVGTMLTSSSSSSSLSTTTPTKTMKNPTSLAATSISTTTTTTISTTTPLETLVTTISTTNNDDSTAQNNKILSRKISSNYLLLSPTSSSSPPPPLAPSVSPPPLSPSTIRKRSPTTLDFSSLSSTSSTLNNNNRQINDRLRSTTISATASTITTTTISATTIISPISTTSTTTTITSTTPTISSSNLSLSSPSSSSSTPSSFSSSIYKLEPVEQPKISKILTPKNCNMKLVNLNISNESQVISSNNINKNQIQQQHYQQQQQQQPQETNNNSNHIIDENKLTDHQHGKNSTDNTTDIGDHQQLRSYRNEMIQKRLAVSLSSLSELLNSNKNKKNNNNNNNNSNNTISEILTNNYNNCNNNNSNINKINNSNNINNNNNNTNNNNNNNNNNYFSGSNILIQQNMSSSGNNNNNKIIIDHDGDTKLVDDTVSPTKSTTTTTTILTPTISSKSVDCRFDHKIQLESTMATPIMLAKKCSPPPLSGRDVEPHTTSHLRRFELEI